MSDIAEPPDSHAAAYVYQGQYNDAPYGIIVSWLPLVYLLLLRLIYRPISLTARGSRMLMLVNMISGCLRASYLRAVRLRRIGLKIL